MRILFGLALATVLSASFCNKTDDSKKSTSSDDDKSGKDKKKKKSGDDDDDTTSACATKFNEAQKDQKDNAFDFKCPADCDPANVWGTGWYTEDSSVCSAAIHSGAIKASKGGKVKVQAKKGLKKYKGTKANGITSADYGEFGGSFTVNDADDGNGTPKKGEAEKITCTDSVNGLGHKDDDSFKAICPPGCKQGGNVWGTDTYTSDSAICRAAVLEGVVTDDDGGPVTVKIAPGQKSYTGSKKNGVKSDDYGSFDTSFTLE